MMDEINSADGYEVALARLDRALGRLEGVTRDLGERAQSHEIVARERQQLQADKNRLAHELTQATAKAERLDESASQVSRRLVDAMENVKTVLAK